MESCREPTGELVRAACAEFDRRYDPVEDVLKELFGQYRTNDDESHVPLKVVTLNCLYSSGVPVYSEKVPNVIDVARHIREHVDAIDSALVDGSPEIVDLIAWVAVSGKKSIKYFSFATKYCSWHKPESYPIWDSRVEKYFECFYKKTRDEGFNLSGHWKYRKFLEAMTYFRKRHHVGSFTFKQIDKFIWLEGTPPDETTPLV